MGAYYILFLQFPQRCHMRLLHMLRLMPFALPFFYQQQLILISNRTVILIPDTSGLTLYLLLNSQRFDLLQKCFTHPWFRYIRNT